MLRPNTAQAPKEAGRKAGLDQIGIPYIRAKAEFDHLDALSRQRSLTDAESLQLERAIKRLDEWTGERP